MKRIRIPTLFLFLLLPVLLASSCRQEEQAEEIIRPVRILSVASADGVRLRSFSGVARAGQVSSLGRAATDPSRAGPRHCGHSP